MSYLCYAHPVYGASSDLFSDQAKRPLRLTSVAISSFELLLCEFDKINACYGLSVCSFIFSRVTIHTCLEIFLCNCCIFQNDLHLVNAAFMYYFVRILC